ncbi:hypothetical protein D3C75_769520 [compost metagenome]
MRGDSINMSIKIRIFNNQASLDGKIGSNVSLEWRNVLTFIQRSLNKDVIFSQRLIDVLLKSDKFEKKTKIFAQDIHFDTNKAEQLEILNQIVLPIQRKGKIQQSIQKSVRNFDRYVDDDNMRN